MVLSAIVAITDVAVLIELFSALQDFLIANLICSSAVQTLAFQTSQEWKEGIFTLMSHI
jgi:hypothetical protein